VEIYICQGTTITIPKLLFIVHTYLVWVMFQPKAYTIISNKVHVFQQYQILSKHHVFFPNMTLIIALFQYTYTLK